MAIWGWLAHLGSLEWGMRGKSQAGKCGLVVGDVWVTLPSWYPTVLLYPEYCHTAGEGMKELLSLLTSLLSWSDLSGAWI